MNGHQCLEVEWVGINNSLSLEATSNPQGATTVLSLFTVASAVGHSVCCHSAKAILHLLAILQFVYQVSCKLDKNG